MEMFHRLKKPTLFVVLFYIFQLIFVGTFLYLSHMSYAKAELNKISEQVQDNIIYKEGQWDTSKYNADPDIPGRFRISIFSHDGFVVERWRPVPGFLDTSDFKRLLVYQKPQTVQTITGQKWRMYSEPIESGKVTLGVIATSKYNPDQALNNETDSELKAAAQTIKQQLIVRGDNIDAKQTDIKSVPFDISFQIVNQFNTILVKNNNASSMDRIPNFIDSSYVKSEMSANTFRTIRSTEDPREKFLIKSFPLKNPENGQAFGMAAVGTTTSFADGQIKNYAIASLVFTLLGASVIAIIRSRKKPLNSEPDTKDNGQPLTDSEVKQIIFDKKTHTLTINDQSVKIAYASNQYYMCEALFSATKKKWEADELLDRFGVELDRNGWRKIYDAMTGINSKASSIIASKLIVNSNKTYRINPVFVDKIIK